MDKKRGPNPVQQIWQSATENICDAQRRIRQRMRIFPAQVKTKVEPVLFGNSGLEEDVQPYSRPPYKGLQLRRTAPIFSIRGRALRESPPVA